MEEFDDTAFETYYGSFARDELTCDYLVIGAGTRGMGFVDGLMSTHKTCKIIIVDERESPGGQWHDAPSWFRVSQLSATYGVPSRKLETNHPRTPGSPVERANKAQVLSYYDAVMEDYIKSGRVRYFPNCTANFDGTQIVSNSAGEWAVNVHQKVVDTTYAMSSLSSSRGHIPPFKVHDGALVKTPKDIPASRTAHLSYVVIGAGRTGMDTMLHLLDQGVPVDRLHWVAPRDFWHINRDLLLSDKFSEFYLKFEHYASSCSTLEDVYYNLEKENMLIRLNPSTFPVAFHGGYLSRVERTKLGRIRNVIRMGHVREVTPSHLVFDEGVYNLGQGTLIIDCTSSAIRLAPPPIPIWTEQRITIQLMTEVACAYSELNPCLSPIVIGYIEGVGGSVEDKNGRCHPSRWPDTVWDWEQLHCDHYKYTEKFQEDKKTQWKLMRTRPTNYALLSAEELHRFSRAMEKALTKKYGSRKEAQTVRAAQARAYAESKGQEKRRFSPRRPFKPSPLLVDASTQTDPREKKHSSKKKTQPETQPEEEKQ